MQELSEWILQVYRIAIYIAYRNISHTRRVKGLELQEAK